MIILTCVPAGLSARDADIMGVGEVRMAGAGTTDRAPDNRTSA
jgi:hypothetical protein